LYDGPEPGLADHRLSVGSFAEPLKLLLSALQRTASGILTSALGDPEYGGRGGSLAREAGLLDIELIDIGQACAAPRFVVVARRDPREAQGRLALDDLPARAAETLVRDLKAESQGKLQNAAARRYLGAMPTTVTRQKYAVFLDGTLLIEAEFGTPALAQLPNEGPALLQEIGQVVAVGFEPGASFVTIKFGEKTTKCSASAATVERALDLRGDEVMAVVLITKEAQLVSLRRAEEQLVAPSMKSTIEHLDTHWGEALRALAQ
jgi:hypothetical protein